MAAVLAGPATALGQTGDQVNGDGTTAFGSRFTLTVDGGVTGANPTGHFRMVGPPDSWEATPRCMNVAGDRATLGFFIDSGSGLGGDLSGHGVLLWMHDVAGPGTIYGKVVGAGQPITCADPLQGPAAALDPIGVSGYLTAIDRHAPSPAGSDSVEGGVAYCLAFFPDQTCERFMSFWVEAASGPAGEQPGGSIGLHEGGPTPGASALSTAAVTCLSVNGHTAIIGVTGSRNRFGASEAVTPFTGLVRVADTIQFAVKNGTKNGPSLPGPTSCSTFPGPFPTGNFQFPDLTNKSGEVVVTDRPPPTSYAQCRSGGWRTFGAFTSQADCLAFVHDRARQACIFERVAHGITAFRSKYGLGPNHDHALRRCIRLRAGG